tara:strand:- start:901 stop:1506 length:606 start_codon:yes stop_codon:yes gene_type:complete
MNASTQNTNNNNNNNDNVNSMLNFIHLTVFVLFSFIFLNAIKKNKVARIKNKNETVLSFWFTMFKELLFVPFLLLIYWFSFTFAIKLLLWFISYIINVREVSKQQNTESNTTNSSVPQNMNINKSSVLNTITSNIFNNLLLDIRIYLYLFIVNIVILISIFIFLLPNLEEKINYAFIDRILIIYQVLIIFSTITLFMKFKK